jgi:hypothetical protein
MQFEDKIAPGEPPEAPTKIVRARLDGPMPAAVAVAPAQPQVETPAPAAAPIAPQPQAEAPAAPAEQPAADPKDDTATGG